GGAGADDGGDERDHARHDDLLAEERAVAGEQREEIGVGAGLRVDARAGGVDEPDHGDAAAQGELAQAADLDLAGGADAAAFDGEVVGGGADHAAVDVPVAADDGVGGRLVVALVGHLGAVDAHLEPLALVEEAVHALARGELAALVLLADLLFAAHLLG